MPQLGLWKPERVVLSAENRSYFGDKFFYLIGPPGSGKTTLFAELTKGAKKWPQTDPFPHIEYPNSGVQLGKMREEFGGTDALAMNIQPTVLMWLEEQSSHNLFAEGDRLANDKFFRTVKDLGYELTVASLQCPLDVLAERWEQRKSNQDPAWVKGRISKCEHQESLWVDFDWFLDGTQPVEALVAKLLTHPVFEAVFKTGGR